MIINSTPYIYRKDQWAFINLYIGSSGSPQERFVEFIINVGHTGQELANAVLLFLGKHGVDPNNCCGQAYGNVARLD